MARTVTNLVFFDGFFMQKLRHNVINCEVPQLIASNIVRASYPQELTLLVHGISAVWLGVYFRSSNGIFESEN